MTILTHPFAATLSLLLALLPAGCASMAPQPAQKRAPPVAVGTTAPFRFGELAIGSMRRGMQIGRYVWDLDCAPPYDDVYWTSGVNMRRGSTVEQRFGETMSAAGFDVVGRPGGPDSPDGNRSRARFTVQGDLLNVQLELCHRMNWLTGGDRGTSGSGSVKVEWTVYDTRGDGLVHRAVTTGAATQNQGVPQGDTLLIEEAIADAVEALAADAGFRTLLSGGTPPAAHAMGMAPPSSTTAPAGSGPVPLTAAAPSPTPSPIMPSAASTAFPSAAPSRLLLRAGSGPGSGRTAASRLPVGRTHGLVIGETEVGGEVQAVLLAPVPGSDPTVTVRPARGVELTGWVVRRDAASGFALVRVPARLSALPLRTAVLRVSEPVRTVPGGREREIAGIVGSLRADAGENMMIQADLGSAALFDAVTEVGDPLLDGSGALVGVAPSAGRSVATPAGLVDFLPVGPLLDRLGADPVGGVSSDHRSDSDATGRDKGGRDKARNVKPNRPGRDTPADRWRKDGELDEDWPDGDVLDEDSAPPT